VPCLRSPPEPLGRSTGSLKALDRRRRQLCRAGPGGSRLGAPLRRLTAPPLEYTQARSLSHPRPRRRAHQRCRPINGAPTHALCWDPNAEPSKRPRLNFPTDTLPACSPRNYPRPGLPRAQFPPRGARPVARQGPNRLSVSPFPLAPGTFAVTAIVTKGLGFLQTRGPDSRLRSTA